MNNYKPFYIVMSVLLIAIAGGVTYFTTRPDKGPTDADAAKTHWICDACEAPYDLTENEVDKALEDPNRHTVGEIPGVNHKFSMLLCDKCKQMAVVLAERCDDHGVWYPVRHIDGSVGGCPDCLADRKKHRR